MKKRLWAAVTAVMMMMSCTCAGAESVKTERVYAVTNVTGEIKSVTDVVLLQNHDHLDTLTDRTALTGIENVSGNETFARDGDIITWNAAGNDIRYQGTCDRTPAITPIVTCELDGVEVTPGELSGRSGRVTIHVDYQLNAAAPVPAITVLLVPDGMAQIETENAILMNEGSRRIIIGYAVPGADEALSLPTGFTVTCDADHADLQWMITFASSDPVSLFCDKTSGSVSDTETLVNQALAMLTALREGTEMPEMDGDLKKIADGLTGILNGVDALSDGADTLSTGAASLAAGAAEASTGAADLASGAASLDTGAASLEAGLTTLVVNNDMLNAGAAQLFFAVLNTANQQLAASGLAEVGITLPELTAENYATVLDGAIGQLTAMIEQGKANAEAQVRAAVTAQEPTIREAVTQAAQAKVLTGVLTAAGLTMTAEEYTAALQAGKIPADQSAQIEAAVTAQMATEDTQAAITAAVNEQIETLVVQNLASEAVQTQINTAIAPAQAAIESLTALKTQLDQVSGFVTGLVAYTDGVSQAQAGSVSLHAGTTRLSSGAATLSAGMTTLSDGSTELSSGAASLADGASQLKTGVHDAANQASDQLIPWLTDNVSRYIAIFHQTDNNAAAAAGYDLCAEGTACETVYIIRTDLK